MTTQYTSKFINFWPTILLTSMLAFPKSFSIYKLFLLLVIFLYVITLIIRSNLKILNNEAIKFYYSFSILSVFWMLWGTINGGHSQAISDAFRLHVIFSLIYCILVIALQNSKSIDTIYNALIYSAWIISLINLIYFVDIIYGFNIFPTWFKEETLLSADIHEGHSQIGSNNINSLFLIVPALFGVAISRKHDINHNNYKLWITLILSLFVVFLSGRRALIFIMFILPLILHIQGKFIVRNQERVRIKLNKLLIATFLIFPFILIGILYASNLVDLNELIIRLSSAFDNDSVRSSQLTSLYNGFSEAPLLGSGVGGSVDVIRSLERPWLYELSYMQLLFNGGVIGFLLVFGLIFIYYIKSIKSIKNFNSHKIEAISLLTGLICFCIGNASNPYFSGFDSLFILGILPLISGWNPYHNKHNFSHRLHSYSDVTINYQKLK